MMVRMRATAQLRTWPSTRRSTSSLGAVHVRRSTTFTARNNNIYFSRAQGSSAGRKGHRTRIEGQHRWLTWSDLHTEHHTLHNLSHHYISGIRLLGPVPTAASLKCHRRACTRNPARQKPVDFRARGHWSRPFVERDFKRRACLPRDPFYAGTSQALKRSGILETQKEQRSCRWASARDEPAGKLC